MIDKQKKQLDTKEEKKKKEEPVSVDDIDMQFDTKNP
jgi:hypothetical protein